MTNEEKLQRAEDAQEKAREVWMRCYRRLHRAVSALGRADRDLRRLDKRIAAIWADCTQEVGEDFDLGEDIGQED